MENQEFVYEDAVRELKEIVSRIENNEVPFSELAKEVKKANALIKRCREELRKSEEEMLSAIEQ